MSPSYKEMKQHVCRYGLLFGCGTICSVSLFVTVLYLNQQCDQCSSFIQFHRFHLPDRPVRSGSHLLQIPVPLRYFPWGFVDILSVIAWSDASRHLIYPKENQIRSLEMALLWLFCLVGCSHTHCPRSYLCAHWRSLRSSACQQLRAHPEVTKSHSRVLL